ncbi:hypothetical protein [Hymenobacter volaticus]|uniref:Uncharacterized protein n=1 Tax=Hymenobacter volaticus TaxID=2932254 RepID=A0ABY4GDS1_9BACT|nr:hypothetical protein [Hymenobacter volaticus]UOQ69057.1 hypothetical protein MUN86_26505 [Hymenobacter volaticus]
MRALRRLSRQRYPGLYLRLLARAQAFPAALQPGSYPCLKQQLAKVQALEEVNSELVR